LPDGIALASERPIAQIAHDLGIHPETLRKRVRQPEADSGKRTGLLSTREREEIRRLRKENYELRRANEILKSASPFSPASSAQTDRSEPLHRGHFGVEPICGTLGVSASALEAARMHRAICELEQFADRQTGRVRQPC
jgi:transposase